jgi:hypothetical protein
MSNELPGKKMTGNGLTSVEFFIIIIIIIIFFFFFFYLALQPFMSLSLLNFEVTRSHTRTNHCR